MLAESPDDVASLLERGKVALDDEQAADAERWLRRAERLAPELPEVHLALARCLTLAGRSAEAHRYQERFAQLDTQHRAKQTEAHAKLLKPG